MRSGTFIACIALLLATAPAGAGSVAGMRTTIADGVTEADVAAIAQGIALAERYFRDVLGVALPDTERRRLRLKVVATGRGDPLGGHGRACCTALPATWARGPRIFVDVGHDNWRRAHPVFARPQDKHLQLIAHEFSHVIIESFMPEDDRLPAWMAEGMAEFFAYDALIRSGRLSRAEVGRFVANRARSLGELSLPLDVERAQGPRIWPGRTGYLAVSGLVAQAGGDPGCLIRYLHSRAGGVPPDAAFALAFGIGRRDFERRFEAYRQANRDRRMPEARWN